MSSQKFLDFSSNHILAEVSFVKIHEYFLISCQMTYLLKHGQEVAFTFAKKKVSRQITHLPRVVWDTFEFAIGDFCHKVLKNVEFQRENI